MRVSRGLSLVAVGSLCLALIGCDLLDRGRQRDALWQAEVEAVALAAVADDAARGEAGAIESLRESRETIAGLLEAPTTPLSPDVTQRWLRVRDLADAVWSHREPAQAAEQAEAELSALVPLLQARLDEVGRLVAEGGTSEQAYQLGRAMLLLDRILRRAERVRHGGSDMVSQADALVRDQTILERLLEGLETGNDELGIKSIARPEARPLIAEVRQRLAGIQTLAEPLFDVQALLERHDAATELPAAVDDLRSALQVARARR